MIIFEVWLKARHGRTTTTQDQWLSELKRSKAEVHVWRPEMIEEIERILE